MKWDEEELRVKLAAQFLPFSQPCARRHSRGWNWRVLKRLNELRRRRWSRRLVMELLEHGRSVVFGLMFVGDIVLSWISAFILNQPWRKVTPAPPSHEWLQRTLNMDSLINYSESNRTPAHPTQKQQTSQITKTNLTPSHSNNMSDTIQDLGTFVPHPFFYKLPSILHSVLLE